MHKNKINILFICPYPVGQSPSQRFRFEQYFSILQAGNYSVEVKPFFSLSAWLVLYQPGRWVRKVFGVLQGFVNRFIVLHSVRRFDFIFVHREATPIGPPWFEWIVAKVFRKKIIYDFDDAIWLSNTSEENDLVSNLKWTSKVRAICKWSYAVSCGNQFLFDYAKQYNDRVYINPTTIDTAKFHNPTFHKPNPKSSKITIGWTGTHSTLKYLDLVLPVIKQLEEKFPDKFQFVVIADKRPSIEFPSLRFVRWAPETEIQDLLQFDIGIMPLYDDVWSKGKCGFKALQYMALEIPAVASPVGVNSTIIEDGIDGFLCASTEQWQKAIIGLISDPVLRKQVGKRGRRKVIDHYSVEANSLNFTSLFE